MLFTMYKMVFTNEYIKVGNKKVNILNALHMNTQSLMLKDYKIINDIEFTYQGSQKDIKNYLGIEALNYGNYTNTYLMTALKKYGKVVHVSLVNNVVVYKDSI